MWLSTKNDVIFYSLLFSLSLLLCYMPSHNFAPFDNYTLNTWKNTLSQADQGIYNKIIIENDQFPDIERHRSYSIGNFPVFSQSFGGFVFPLTQWHYSPDKCKVRISLHLSRMNLHSTCMHTPQLVVHYWRQCCHQRAHPHLLWQGSATKGPGPTCGPKSDYRWAREPP